MTAPARFKQDDIARAVAGARKGGAASLSVSIEPTGQIVLHMQFGESAQPPAPAQPGAGGWDGVVEDAKARISNRRL